MSRGFIYLLVFIEGLTTLGSELAASRLLAPYFGTSLIVWSALIGLILLSLSVGYWLGGVWIDKRPTNDTFFMAVTLSCASVGLVPIIARPILLAALQGMGNM